MEKRLLLKILIALLFISSIPVIAADLSTQSVYEAPTVKNIKRIYNLILKNMGQRDRESINHLTNILDQGFLWQLTKDSLISRNEKIKMRLQESLEFLHEGHELVDKEITIIAPDVPPLSGAEVIIVKIGGISKYVIKLMDRKKGPEEVINAVLANNIFKEKSLNVGEIRDAGPYIDGQKQGYYLIMDFVEGTPISVLIRKNNPDAQNALNNLGVALASFHKLTHNSNPSRADIQNALRYQARIYEEATKREELSRNVAWMDSISECKKTKQNYLSALFKSWQNYFQIYQNAISQSVYLSEIHGDAHTGNFFFDKSEKIQIIDTETMTWSYGGNSDAAEDVGRVIASIWMEGVSMKPDELQSLEDSFLNAYINELQMSKKEFMEKYGTNIHYMALKFFSLTAKEDPEDITRQQRICKIIERYISSHPS